MAKRSIEGKLLAAAAGVAASLPVAAAAVPLSGGGPITIAMNDPAGVTPWDVDRDGTADFNLINRDEPADTPVFEFLSISSVGLNGRGFVGPARARPAVTELPSGARIGPALTTNYWGVADDLRQVAGHTVTFSEPALGVSWLTQSDQPVLIGFRFDSGRGLQYGWASVLVDFDGGQTALTIQQWAYESEPDTDVVAGQVDAPASGLAALTLLGLGAAGLRRYRKQKAA